MKLFSKYNRINIAATIIIFLAGSCTFFFLLRYILIHQLDETLQSEQQEIFKYVTVHHQLPEIINTKEQHTTFLPVTSYPAKASYYSLQHKYDNGSKWYREISFGIDAGDRQYLAIVNKPLEETEDLLQIIISVTMAMIALILLAGYFINRSVLTKLWNPFYESVRKVQQYDVNANKQIELSGTDIDEFRLLNDSITTMTERTRQDYQSLKEFTGQAAHEMQTPLAIMRTRLDMLIQDEELAGRNQQPLQDIEKSVSKLSHLYQSLLLLTRIENRQFALNETVVLDKVINEKLTEYAELINAKKLNLSASLEACNIRFHPLLTDIVIGNLINNAIRYNIPDGSISVTLKNCVLTIANTSELPPLDKNKVFQRFYRHQQTKPDGNGLGLSIIRQICDLGSYVVEYQYAVNEHQFIIHF